MTVREEVSPQHYDALFYRYQREGSLRSARLVVPLICDALLPGSVIDVGCGAGAWLASYQEAGVVDAVGVDGDYVDRSLLLIAAERFRAHNVAAPFDLGRRFDVVQCVEVAEHVPRDRSTALVDNLVRHGYFVVFSAAVPGQGGKDHINERPYGFWRDLFAERGYRLFDFLRPALAGKKQVEPWYRFNLLFFAHDDVIDRLPAVVRSHRIPDNANVPDTSPLVYRLQKLAMRGLPRAAVSRLAVLKHQHAVRKLLRAQKV